MAITLEISIYILLEDAPLTLLVGHVSVPPVPPGIFYGAILLRYLGTISTTNYLFWGPLNQKEGFLENDCLVPKYQIHIF